jgi:syndecan 1
MAVLILLALSSLAAVTVGQDDQLDPLEALANNIPGVPGQDYPIFAFPPDTTLTCDAKIEGYYADPEADCQAFHICANDSSEGKLKYSFLCPNGTLFNQQYFICDWWFNVDCSQAEDFYSLNADVKAAGDAATEAARNGRDFPDVEGLASERGGRRAQG